MVWQFKKVKGGEEHTLRIKISLQDERIPNVRKELGPVSLGRAWQKLSLRRRMPFDSRNQGEKCVSMTWRATCACPWSVSSHHVIGGYLS